MSEAAVSAATERTASLERELERGQKNYQALEVSQRSLYRRLVVQRGCPQTQSKTTLKFLARERKAGEKLEQEAKALHARLADQAASATAQPSHNTDTESEELLQLRVSELGERLADTDRSVEFWRTKHDNAVEDRQNMVEKLMNGSLDGSGMVTKAEAADRLQRELTECRAKLADSIATIRRLEEFTPAEATHSGPIEAGIVSSAAQSNSSQDLAATAGQLELLRSRLTETDPRYLGGIDEPDLDIEAEDLIELR